MPRPLTIDEIACEVQAEVLEAQEDAIPLWPAARKSPLLMEHCRRLAKLLRLSRQEAREIAGLAEEAA